MALGHMRLVHDPKDQLIPESILGTDSALHTPPPTPSSELLPGCHLPLGSVSADEAESPGLVAAQMAL